VIKAARNLRPERHLAWLFAVLAAGCLTYACVMRGIWLDEFWSLRIARFDAPLIAIFSDRWLGEANPPLSNFLYLLVLSMVTDDLVLQRLLLNGSALAFLFVGLQVTNREPIDSDRRFQLILFILVASQQAWALGTSELRVYGWLMAAFAVAASYVRSLTDRTEPPRPAAMVVGGIAVILSISLHYVAGLVASLFVVVAMGGLIVARRGNRIMALAIPAGVGLVSTAIFGAIFVQRSRATLDYQFIVGTPWAAALLIVVMLVTTLLANPVAAFLAAKSRTDRPPVRATSFAAIVTATIVTAPVFLVVLHFLRPVVVERYLAGWQVLVCALVAHLAANPRVRSRLLDALLVGIGAAMMMVMAAQAGANRGWHDGADRIADHVKKCPTTRVFAMSSWRLQKGRRTIVAAAENDLMAHSYRALATKGRFAVTMLDLDSPAILPVGIACPTLVWVEHLDPDYIRDAAHVQRVGRITFATAADVRVEPGTAGFVLVANAAQNRREIPK
jgi:hypothetical protein